MANIKKVKSINFFIILVVRRYVEGEMAAFFRREITFISDFFVVKLKKKRIQSNFYL